MQKICFGRLLFFTAFTIQVLACSKKAVDIPAILPGEPVISSVFPAKARGGDTITARGTNFPSNISAIKITLNNKQAKIIKLTSDSLQAIIPEMAGTGNITMNIGAKTYAGPEVEYAYQVTVTTIAGDGSTGTNDGAGNTASFYCPWGIAVDANDNLFVADCYNRLIRKIASPAYEVSSYPIPVLVNGNSFYSPYNITVDKVSRDVYVTDFNEHLMRMDAAGNMYVIYNGTMPLAGIGIAPDRKNLFITNNSAGTIIKTDMDGGNASVFTSDLITPRNVFFNNQGKMFVAAYPGPVYEISSTGVATAVISVPGFSGWEIVTDTSGNFFLADHVENCIKMIDRSGNIFTIAGSGDAEDVDGIGLDASFNGPQGIAIDSKGHLYVTTFNYDTYGGNKVRKITIR